MKSAKGTKQTGNKKKKAGFIDVILLIFAAVTLANYVTYFLHLLVFPESTTAVVISLAVIGITALPIIFVKQLKRILKKAFGFFKAVWGLGLSFYVISFSVMCCLIFIGAGTEAPAAELPGGTAFIVYGAKVQGSSENPYPGTVLRYRLNHAYSVMKDVDGSVCIVCGGKGQNENAVEGEVMKSYLVKLGFDEKRIFVDGESKNTLENVVNAKKIIEDNSLTDRKIACVSTGFHIPRIKYLCSKYGVDVSYCYYADSPNPVSLYTSLVREYMSYGKLVLTGHL